MEWLLPLGLGAVALVYICAPFWSGASDTGKVCLENWHTVEQLELDRDMGKIDEAEYEELKPKAPVRGPQPVSLEGLIYGVRRRKRAEVALETEVLIARARGGRGGGGKSVSGEVQGSDHLKN